MRSLIGRPALTALASVLATLAGCSDDVDVGQLQGKIEALETVDFGDVQVGILLPMELEVKNSGNAAFSVTQTKVADNFTGPDYEFKIVETSFTLAPSETKRIHLSFQPFADMTAPVESFLTFVTDISDPASGSVVNFTVRLKGRGIRTGLEVVPNPVDFGTVLVGSTKTLDVKITNRLSIPVDLLTRMGSNGKPEIPNQSGLGRFELVNDPAPNGSLLPADKPKLMPGDFITVQARYVPDPSQDGAMDMGRWVLDNCGNPLCETPVPMIGKGTNAALQCEPPAVDFGDVNPEVTVTQQVRCTNVASEMVLITGWTMGPGSASEYSVVPYAGTPSQLAPGASFVVEVQFSPTLQTIRQGQRPTGAVVITGKNPRANNRDLNPTRIELTGNAGGPDIAVTPAQINFGQVAIGTSSKRRILVENTGYSALSVSMITADVAGTGVFTVNRTSFMVPSADSLVVEVTYTPTAEVTSMSELLIASDDSDEREVRIPLQGQGIQRPPCSYVIVPEDINFGIVQVLRPSIQGFRIENTGPNECFVNDLDVAPGTSAEFRLVDGPETNVTIAPNTSKAVLVEYMPNGDGTDMGLVTFYISSPGSSNAEVPLRGVGSSSALLISPNEINFGKIGVDCSTRDRTITIYNTGGVSTRILRIEIPSSVSSEFTLGNLPAGIPSPPGAGTTIAAGQSREFTVRYHANDVGVDVGFLHIYEAGRADPYVVPLFGEGSTDPVNEDAYTQLENPAVDILFVVDNSCSMSEEQAALAANFSSFIQFAVAQALDYRIASVTTDVDGGGFSGMSCPTTPPAQRPAGLPQGACGYFADGDADGTQQNGEWRLITPDEQPSPEAAFAAITHQGTDGSGTEKGLEAAYQALSSPRTTGWNSGFLRQDAYLALVFVSDEEDQSDNTVDFYVNFFKAIKGFRNTHLFSASAIVGDRPNGCGGGSADAGLRYVETAERTGGIFESICTTDWAQALQNLGLSVFGYKSRFFLSNQPVRGTVEVYVDGVKIEPSAPSGQVRWSYDGSSNTVNFAPLAIPEPGSEIVIRYRAECL